MECESGATRTNIDELYSWVIQADQMEGESGFTGIIIDEPQSTAMIKWKGKVVLFEVSLMSFILRISKEIKWKVKVVLLEVSLMNFILRIHKEIKWKVKVVLLKVSLMNFILLI